MCEERTNEKENECIAQRGNKKIIVELKSLKRREEMSYDPSNDWKDQF